MHSELDMFAYCPVLQVSQVTRLGVPSFPSGHSLQEAWPRSSWYRPPAHLKHALWIVDPEGLYWPNGHAAHTSPDT